MDYEYEIAYEYEFSILVFRLHIITSHTHFILCATLRPSKGVFDVALSLVCQLTCRLFGKGQMSLSLFRHNTNVAVLLNSCDAVSIFHNLLSVSARKRRLITHKLTYNFTYVFNSFIRNKSHRDR